MINCVQCKNNGYCISWKNAKIDIRTYIENIEPINLIAEMIMKVSTGEDIAAGCKKFQEFSKRNLTL